VVHEKPSKLRERHEKQKKILANCKGKISKTYFAWKFSEKLSSFGLLSQNLLFWLFQIFFLKFSVWKNIKKTSRCLTHSKNCFWNLHQRRISVSGYLSVLTTFPSHFCKATTKIYWQQPTYMKFNKTQKSINTGPGKSLYKGRQGIYWLCNCQLTKIGLWSNENKF
jgi:hypothetical protein